MQRSQQRGATIKVVKVADVTAGNARSWVFYGRSGTGKTTLAATFPSPILLIDVLDRGTDSIADVKNVDVMRPESLEEVEDAYWHLHDNPKKYKTVIIDTVSQLQTLVVAEKMRKSGKDVSTANVVSWGSMRKQDWGDVAAVLKALLSNFRDLADDGIEVVFLAQDRSFNTGDDDDGDNSLAPEVGPALSPSVAKSLNASVHVIGNTFVRERQIIKEVKGKKIRRSVMEYCLGLGASSLYTRKVRKPRSVELPDAIVNPTYDDLLDIIEGE